MKKKLLFVLLFVIVPLISKDLAIRSIELYQNHLSPHKGWKCAYSIAHPNELSCSAFGKKAIEVFGTINGSKQLWDRFNDCAVSYLILGTQKNVMSAGCCGPKNFKQVPIELQTLLIKQLSEENGAIPPNFGKDTTSILLCCVPRAKKIVTTRYHGKYEFVKSSTIHGMKPSQYDDKIKYRYLFGVEEIDAGTAYIYSAQTQKLEMFNQYLHYPYVLDRQTNRKYVVRDKDTEIYLSLKIEVYLINLEKKRQSFIP